MRAAPPATSARHWLFAAPALLVIIVFIVIPYINIGVMSLRTPSSIAAYGPGFTLAN
jgi:putative spermidine/putrescine transport system permease protein